MCIKKYLIWRWYNRTGNRNIDDFQCFSWQYTFCPSTPPTKVKVHSDLSYLGRPAELDPLQVRPWQGQFTFLCFFPPWNSSSNNCFSHICISRKSHENVPVNPAMNFPPNSTKSRDSSLAVQLPNFSNRCHNAQLIIRVIY